MFWTYKQRISLSLVLLAILTLIFIRYHFNPAYISNPQPQYPPRATELLDRIDPNTADAATLAALPSIGPAMVRRIIEDREQFRAVHPNGLPYRQLNDLLRVKGIGQATLENLKPYLMFPPPTTQPGSI
jgi:DNA uptake protein ComE-like DNA-binding protein